MNYYYRLCLMLLFIVVLSGRQILAQEEAPDQIQASLSKAVEKPLEPNSRIMLGPVSIRLVNEPVIGAIKKVAELVRLRPVLDYDLIKSDKKINLTLNVATLPEALDEILDGMDIQYSITESGLLVFRQDETPQGQSGTIKGVVTDVSNKETLIGVNVVIIGTSLGASTDIEGEFRIVGIPRRMFKVKASCVGYEPKIIEIDFSKNASQELNIQLKTEVIQGEEVVVTAQMRGQMAAINTQITSNIAINVVAADRIQELPDANAAEAIGRLPGISLRRSGGEANKVVIRGMEPKFNAITINGVKIPSSDNDDRSIDLSMISPEMLEGIEVFKTATPDMDAEASGGTVNLKIKKAPQEGRFQLKLGPGYNQIRKDLGAYKTSGEYSGRFFDNAIGLVAIGNYEKVNRSAENFSGSYSVEGRRDSVTGILQINGNNLTIRSNDEIRTRWGASATLDYSFENGSIWVTNFYSSTLRNAFNTSKRYDQSAYTYNVQTLKNTTDGLNSSFNGDIHFWGMTMDWVLARYKVESVTDYNLTYTFAEPALYNTTDPSQPMWQLYHIDTYAPSAREDLSTLLLNTVLFQPDNTPQTEYTAVYNLKIPFRVGDFLSGNIKAGGKYLQSHKKYTNDRKEENHYGLNNDMYYKEAQKVIPWTLLTNGPNINAENFVSSTTDYHNVVNNTYKLFPLFNRGVMEKFYYYLAPSLGFVVDVRTNPRVDWYELEERTSAGYLMTELNFGQFLTVIPGVRYESSDNYYQAYSAETYETLRTDSSVAATKFDSTSYRRNHYFLPHLHIKIKPTEWFNLMLSANQTLARPNYSWISPWQRMNAAGQQVSQGNTRLRDTKVSGYNITANFYDNVFGLFSVSGFYKDLRDISYRMVFNVNTDEDLALLNLPVFAKGYEATTYVNSNRAQIRGVEFDLQTKLFLIPGIPTFLRGVVINLNYSSIWSQTFFPLHNFIATPKVPQTRPPTFTYDDQRWERPGPMPGQANNIANISVGYDIGGLSTRLSVVYQGRSIASLGRIPEEDVWNNDFWRWDASVRYRFNPMLSFNLNVTNITNQPDRAFYGSDQYVSNLAYYGLTASAGIEITL